MFGEAVVISCSKEGIKFWIFCQIQNETKRNSNCQRVPKSILLHIWTLHRCYTFEFSLHLISILNWHCPEFLCQKRKIGWCPKSKQTPQRHVLSKKNLKISSLKFSNENFIQNRSSAREQSRFQISCQNKFLLT